MGRGREANIWRFKVNRLAIGLMFGLISAGLWFLLYLAVTQVVTWLGL
jgi:hypothetical protein